MEDKDVCIVKFAIGLGRREFATNENRVEVAVRIRIIRANLTSRMLAKQHVSQFNAFL